MKLSLVALARRRTQGFYDPIHSGLGRIAFEKQGPEGKECGLKYLL